MGYASVNAGHASLQNYRTRTRVVALPHREEKVTAPGFCFAPTEKAITAEVPEIVFDSGETVTCPLEGRTVTVTASPVRFANETETAVLVLLKRVIEVGAEIEHTGAGVGIGVGVGVEMGEGLGSGDGLGVAVGVGCGVGVGVGVGVGDDTTDPLCAAFSASTSAPLFAIGDRKSAGNTIDAG